MKNDDFQVLKNQFRHLKILVRRFGCVLFSKILYCQIRVEYVDRLPGSLIRGYSPFLVFSTFIFYQQEKPKDDIKREKGKNWKILDSYKIFFTQNENYFQNFQKEIEYFRVLKGPKFKIFHTFLKIETKLRVYKDDFRFTVKFCTGNLLLKFFRLSTTVSEETM